jgi:hypothetical protein
LTEQTLLRRLEWLYFAEQTSLRRLEWLFLQNSGAAAARTQATKGSGTTMELVQPNPEEPQVMNICGLPVE